MDILSSWIGNQNEQDHRTVSDPGTIDHIGTDRVNVRRTPNGGIAIRVLDGSDRQLALTSPEWYDLVALAHAVRAAEALIDADNGARP